MREKFRITVEDRNVTLTPWYILSQEVFLHGIKELSNGEVSLDSLFIFERDKTYWGSKPGQFAQVVEYFTDKIAGNKVYQKKLVADHYEVLREIKVFCGELLETDFSSQTDKELYCFYKRFYDLSHRSYLVGTILNITDMSEVRFSDRVKKQAAEEVGEGNFEVTFSRLITPTKPTLFGQEMAAVWGAIRSLQAEGKQDELKRAASWQELDIELQAKISSLADKFGWLQYYYIGPPAGPEYYFDLIKGQIDSDADSRIKDEQRQSRELGELHHEYGQKLSPETWGNIQLLREFAFVKEYRKEIQTYYMNYAMDKWFREAGKRLYISPLQAKYVLRGEYEAAFVQAKKLDTEDISKRYNACAYLLEGGELTLLSGQEAKKCWEKFEAEELKDGLEELRGTVAYPGRVRGIARIVNSVDDMNNFQNREVLVSISTNPSLMPAINRAAAVVTDSGGITCHAAIVSRELKIPCVIGTKHATKFIQDGDGVEVDAEQGVVKKIG